MSTDRVLIVDDHAWFRDVLRRVLVADGFVIVGESPSGEHALAAVDELAPDVVLVDVQLPGLDGFEVADRVAAASEVSPVVVLISSRAEQDYRHRLATSPARGFIQKSHLSPHTLRDLLDG